MLEDRFNTISKSFNLMQHCTLC